MTDVLRPSTARPGSAAPPTLAKELSDFLVELSVALHRRAMYPGGHPSLATAEQRVMQRVTPLLADSPVLAVGVARDQLVIDGVATDPRHHLLRGLAQRLHEHRLAGFRFQEGLTTDEITGFLQRLARDPEEHGREPLSVPGTTNSPWRHIGVYRQSYERLELADDDSDDGLGPRSLPRAAQLWLELAQAAMTVVEIAGGNGTGGGGGGGVDGGAGGGAGDDGSGARSPAAATARSDAAGVRGILDALGLSGAIGAIGGSGQSGASGVPGLPGVPGATEGASGTGAAGVPGMPGMPGVPGLPGVLGMRGAGGGGSGVGGGTGAGIGPGVGSGTGPGGPGTSGSDVGASGAGGPGGPGPGGPGASAAGVGGAGAPGGTSVARAAAALGLPVRGAPAVPGAGGAPAGGEAPAGPATTDAASASGGAIAAVNAAPAPPRVDTDPTAVATAINTRSREAAYEQAVVGYLLQIAQELRASDNADTAVLRSRVSGLVRSLSPDAIRRLLEMGGNLTQRRTFLADASAGMATDAVLTLTVAAAQVSQQAISKPLLRLLVKLATHAKRGAASTRSAADTAFREHVREMVDNWTLPDPTSVDYGRVLDRMTSPADERSHLPGITQMCEAERTIEMSLELRNAAPPLWDAVTALIGRGDIMLLLDMLEATPADNPLPGVIRTRIATPENFARLLESPTVETGRIEDFARRVGVAGTEVLLDALGESQSRATRRKLLGAIGHLGDGIGAAIVARLPGAPWYTQRNLLILLAGVARWPEDFSPLPYATHSDARVRREALRLMIRRPATRSAGVAAAVGDADHQIVRLGLDASQKDCPTAAVPRLVQTISNGTLPADLQVLAVRALASSGAPAAIPCLLELTTTRTRWFRRERVAHKSSIVLAALTALSANWSSDPLVARLLTHAARSADPDIRAAAARAAA